MKKIVIAATVLATTSLFAANTAACAGCHGANFEKSAMGKSKIVKDMSKDEIVTALKGYRDTDGFGHSAMKAAMAGQAKALSDADIEEIATSIAKK
jgi:cytochrome c-type protein NapB